MLELARGAAAASGRATIAGRVSGLTAICRHQQGRWGDAIDACRQAQQLIREDPRLSWDRAIMEWWELTAAACAGGLSELVARIPELLRDAEARGDVYAATAFRTHRSSWAWLAQGRPEIADAQVDIAEREWTPLGYQFQHWHMLYSRSEIDLYRGTPERSFERFTGEWKRSRLVRQVHGVHADMLYTRARLLLALALSEARPSERRRLVRAAAKDGRALGRMKVTWARALGKLVLAGAAAFEDRVRAQQLLQEVAPELAALELPLHAGVARLRRAELAGGATAQAEIDAELGLARSSGASDPERFYRVLLPAAPP
jgi:hypothetical protein